MLNRRRRGKQSALQTSRTCVRPVALCPLQGKTNARLIGTLVFLEGRRRRLSQAKTAPLHGSPPVRHLPRRLRFSLHIDYGCSHRRPPCAHHHPYGRPQSQCNTLVV